MRPDTVCIVDGSGGNDTGPRPKKDALWAGVVRDGAPDAPVYFRNRPLIETWLTDLVEAELTAGRRLLLGFDFAFGYPAGFARALTGRDDPLAVWHWYAERVEDAPKTNNRFDVAGQINARFEGIGPFWGNGLKRDIPHLPRKGRARTCTDFAERRAAEARAKGAFPVWQLSGAGAVGGQVIMGLPVLHRLRQRFAPHVAVWPFEPLDTQVSIVEVWPSLLSATVTRMAHLHAIKDAVQVTVLARAIAALDPGALSSMLEVSAPEEGWIFGLGHEQALTL